MIKSCQSVLRVMVGAVFIALSACDSHGDGTSHEKFKGAQPGAAELPDVRLVPAFPGVEFERPVAIVEAPDGTKRLFVVAQDGQIQVLKPGAKSAPVFLDISRKVHRDHNEEGLLSLAFHPDYAKNGYFYVWYSADSPLRHVLSRFRVSKDAGKADPGSETVLIEIPKPYGNHNGATLMFGKDGFLYFSVGDGGAANDPAGHGQNLKSWLAKIHRIDVDKTEGKKPYAVPKDNPFVGRKDALPETWAYGLRNVWRMSFDRETGELWAGDVGQNKYEEIDRIDKGGNYGWRVREGSHGFRNEPPTGTAPIDPIIEYGRGDGNSVTGGYVYRGKKQAKLIGAYIYADFTTGTMWALRSEKDKVTAWKQILAQPKNISSFGEDSEGEIYVVAFDGGIYRLEEK